MSRITINGISLDPVAQADALSVARLEAADASKSNYILIQTSEPLSSDQAYQLTKLGVVIHQYVSENTFTCAATRKPTWRRFAQGRSSPGRTSTCTGIQGRAQFEIGRLVSRSAPPAHVARAFVLTHAAHSSMTMSIRTPLTSSPPSRPRRTSTKTASRWVGTRCGSPSRSRTWTS